MSECTCHNEYSPDHELCCGHSEGRDPDCPYHGDGTTSGFVNSVAKRNTPRKDT